jgi:putative tryptophan/tyrosine transport system substrate-binding protein
MAKKRKKPKLLAADIGIIHSGTSGKHDKRVKDLKAGIALFSNTNPRNVKYAKDKPGQLDVDAQALGDGGVSLLIAAGGTRSALAAVNFGRSKPVIVTSISSPSVITPPTKVAGVCARTTELDPMRLQLLLELVPSATKVGAMCSEDRPDAQAQKGTLDNKAIALGLAPLIYRTIDADDNDPDGKIEAAFQDWKNAGVKAAIITADSLFNNHMDTIVKAAALKKIPTIYQWREFAEAGGLISYGPNLSLAYKIAGTFAGRVAAGLATVPQLPLLSLESFELVINLKAANDLNLAVPPALLARATDVIVE